MKKIILCNLLLTLHAMAEATTPELVMCPTPHPRYTDLLRKLEGLEKVFDEDAQCKSIATDIHELHDKYASSNRSIIDPVLNAGKRRINPQTGKPELQVEEIKAIGDYSATITATIGSILQKLEEKPNCSKEKQTPLLVAIADVVQETTGIASQFSGPYGMIVAVGGTAVGGILRGINLIMERRNKGFNFNEREKRAIFVANMCSYHHIRSEMEDIIRPENRLKVFRKLNEESIIKRKYLLDPQADFNGDGEPDPCHLCSVYDTTYSLDVGIKSSFQKFEHNLNQIRKMVSVPGQEVATCIALADYVSADRDELTDNNQFPSVPQNTFGKLEIEHLREIYDAILTIPRFKQCTDPNEQIKLLSVNNSAADISKLLMARNQASLALVEHLASSSQVTFHAIYDELIRKGHKEYIESGRFTENLVEYLAHALFKRDWSQREIANLELMSNGGSAQIQRELNDLNLFLRAKYFTELSPKFIVWHQEDSVKNSNEYESRFKKTVADLNEFLTSKSTWVPKWSATAEELKNIIESVKQSKDKQTHLYTFSRLRELLMVMDTSLKSAETIDVYCKYYFLSLTVTPEIRRSCSDLSLAKMKENINKHSNSVRVIEDYLKWATTNGMVPVEDTEAVIRRMREFRERVKIIPK